MIEPPQILQTAAQSAAVIRLTIPRSEIREVMGPAMREVRTEVAAQGIVVSGPLFSHHFRMSPEVFDFEVGIPVEGLVAVGGRVVPGELPGGALVRTVYHGGYEGLESAWGEFDAWIASQGMRTGEDLWECYLTGPGEPARTELNRRLPASE